MMQYLPKDGLYVYFRYDEKETVMCVLNTGSKAKEINLNDYAERTKKFTSAANIISGKNVGNKFSVDAKETLVLLLQ